jgi:hypothetical protein
LAQSAQGQNVAKYRKVDVRIWNDAKFVSLSERGKLVFMFLMTHPNLTMVGAMRATIPGLAAEIGIPLEGFREAFQEGLAKGMARLDEHACLVWLPNFLKYNKPESPNVVKAWPNAFDLLPECALKAQIFQHVKDFMEGFTEGFRKAFQEAFPEDFAKGMAKQEQEQKQKLVPNGTCRSGERPEEFANLWNQIRGPLPKVKEFSDSRRKKVKTRIAQGLTLEKFEKVISECVETPFLAGDNGTGWQATFDWLIENDRNMAKVMEGVYKHGGNGGNGAARPMGRARTDGNLNAAREALQRMACLPDGISGRGETRGGESPNLHGVRNPVKSIRPAGYIGGDSDFDLAASL